MTGNRRTPGDHGGGVVFGAEPWRKDRMHIVRAAILPVIASAKTFHEVELGCEALLTACRISDALDREQTDTARKETGPRAAAGAEQPEGSKR